MARYITGASREQLDLLPPSLDDLIPDDHLVRVIDLYVDSLDLDALGFERARPAATGRPGYHPADMLRLYLYGYLQQIRSSRRLERECQRNIELMWLLNRLTPDFKTIAEFRRKHPRAFRQLCRHFVRFCRDAGWLARREVAIDGSKFGAVASKKRVVSRQALVREEQALNARIDAWLEGLDETDHEEAHRDGPDDDQRRRSLERLKALRDQTRDSRERMERLGIQHHVTGEPEARLMRSPQGSRTAYNLQTAVDTDTHLIVHHETVQDGDDSRQLQPMAEATQTALERGDLSILADAGYSNGEQQQRCEERNLACHIPPRRTVNNQGGGQLYQADAFHYEPARDAYRCPADHWLPLKQRNASQKVLYYANPSACAGCRLKPRCTAGRWRTVTRHQYESAFETSRQRLTEDPKAMTRRRATVEHPFGTLKDTLMGNAGRLLVRGLDKARGEISLAVLAYNLKRLMRHIGAEALMTRLRQAPV
ncbi:IS1182 family transposase [Chromohalobacter israelensis]|uniref:IS1182 family transposase n=1 Tax=Chromohalobacter israelensis TaxID=141390 RepID=UPI000552BF2B|nr:IS1182 family transposase [Chromohalobacter israelensis]